MATVSHPIPSLPVGMMQLKLRWLWQPVPGYQEFWADLFFYAYGGVTWAHFPSTFFSDLYSNFMQFSLHDITPTGMQNPSIQVFVSTTVTTLSARFQPVNPNLPGREPLAMFLRPCFTKLTDEPSRVGVGRFYGPPCPQVFVRRNRFSNLGLIIYDSFVQTLNAGLSLGGIDWTSVHWSRSANTIYPTTNFRLCEFPRILRKSVLRTPYLRPLYVWPTVV